MLTFAIGDVHGCAEKLLNLFDHCMRFAGEPARFVLLGDYVDRGPNTKEVITFLIDVRKAIGDNLVAIKGNHEDMLLNAVNDPGADLNWMANGCGPTLASYGVEHPSDIPSLHLHFISTMDVFVCDDRRVFVHGGVNPLQPLDRQVAEHMMWARPVDMPDDQLDGFERFIVHGHTPTKDRLPDLRPRRLNLDTGAVFGGPLTAGVFNDEQTRPIALINDSGEVTVVGQ